MSSNRLPMKNVRTQQGFTRIGGWVLLLAVLTAFASAALFTRRLLAHHWAQPDTLMALRYAVSASVTMSLGLFGRRSRPPIPWSWAYLGGGGLMALQALCFGLASQRMAVSVAGLCFFGGASLTTAGLGAWLQSRMPTIQRYGLFLGIAGLILVLRPGGAVDGPGIFLAVLGGVAWGVYVVASPYYMPSDSGSLLVATGRTMALGSALVWGIATIAEPHGISVMTPIAWGTVLYIGIIPQALGLVALNWLAARLNPVQLGVSLIGTPLLVVVGGVMLLDEPSVWTLWAGLGCVVGGIVLASRNPSPPPKS